MAVLSEKEQIELWIAEILADKPSLFVVSVKVKSTKDVKVYIDGDDGFPIAEAVSINRRLYKLIEETGMYEAGTFSLEVSSPGITEPLKLTRQFIKNIGRDIEVILKKDEVTLLGKLMEATDGEVVLEVKEGKGKKAVIKTVTVLIDEIKSAIVQIKF